MNHDRFFYKCEFGASGVTEQQSKRLHQWFLTFLGSNSHKKIATDRTQCGSNIFDFS